MLRHPTAPRPLLALVLAGITLAGPALARPEITIAESSLRAAGAMAIAGAAFFTIYNAGDEDDRLIGATSDAARRLELHRHIAEGDVMRMGEVEAGFGVPAGGMHRLERGGEHVMFMGLTRPLEQGELVQVTLIFEKAGEIAVEIPVDNGRAPGAAMEGLAQERRAIRPWP